MHKGGWAEWVQLSTGAPLQLTVPSPLVSIEHCACLRLVSQSFPCIAPLSPTPLCGCLLGTPWVCVCVGVTCLRSHLGCDKACGRVFCLCLCGCVRVCAHCACQSQCLSHGLLATRPLEDGVLQQQPPPHTCACIICQHTACSFCLGLCTSVCRIYI